VETTERTPYGERAAIHNDTGVVLRVISIELPRYSVLLRIESSGVKTTGAITGTVVESDIRYVFFGEGLTHVLQR
jgi:hypothetical protein